MDSDGHGWGKGAGASRPRDPRARRPSHESLSAAPRYAVAPVGSGVQGADRFGEISRCAGECFQRCLWWALFWRCAFAVGALVSVTERGPFISL